MASRIEIEREALSNIQNEIRLIANDLRKKLHEDSWEIFDKQRPRLMQELLRQLREDIRGWKCHLGETSEAFRHWVETNFVIRLTPISDEYGSELSERYLDRALDSYSRVVRAFQDRLAQEIEKALHIKFPGAKFEVKIPEPKKPDIHIGNVFVTPWEILWFFIPMRLFRPLVNRHFINRLPWDVNINLGRLGSQWTEAISNSIEDIAQQAKVFIQQEIDTVENLLTNAPDHQSEIENAIGELGTMKTNMTRI